MRPCAWEKPCLIWSTGTIEAMARPKRAAVGIASVARKWMNDVTGGSTFVPTRMPMTSKFEVSRCHCASAVLRCILTASSNLPVLRLICSCFFSRTSRLLSISRMPLEERPPPNARDSSWDCLDADKPLLSRCSFRSPMAPISPFGPRMASASWRPVNPILPSCFSAALDGAPSSENDIRSRVAADAESMPSSVIRAKAAPTCFIDRPNVFADGRMPVPIAALNWSIDMLPAPMIAFTVETASWNEVAPLMPVRHAPASALVVSSRLA